jgi:hypothetical protein
LPASRAPAEHGFDVLIDSGIGPMIRAVEQRVSCAMAGADSGRAVALVSAPTGAGVFVSERGLAKAISGPRFTRGN